MPVSYEARSGLPCEQEWCYLSNGPSIAATIPTSSQLKSAHGSCPYCQSAWAPFGSGEELYFYCSRFSSPPR
jgi:hypothetical protein